MLNPPASVEDQHIEVINDDETPFTFVSDILRSVFGKPESEAAQMTQTVHLQGMARLGPYAPQVAQAMVDTVRQRARSAGYPLVARVSADSTAAPSSAPACSFCGRAYTDSRQMYRGGVALICDACVISSAHALQTATPYKSIRNVFELLDWHFGGMAEAELVSVQRSFPLRMRADLQRALDEVLGQPETRVFGVHGANAYEELTFSSLMAERRHPKTLGPLQYEEIDVGDDRPVRCLMNALWLKREGETPLVVLLGRKAQHDAPGATITVAAPAGAHGKLFADGLFKQLEDAVAQARSYRGKVLSLEAHDHYRGFSTGITVHRLPAIGRDEVVLPESTVHLLERNIIRFAQVRRELVALGQSGKKGLLFYGPPGTGKTHTVRYLAGCLPDHTTLLITAAQIGMIGEYFALARLLQPAILVIEDADLIARDRERMESPCEEVLLNQLLNEMDGLKADAELFVVLTTNRPQALEAALAQRPGRIDQAIEFPVPDLANRLKLIDLYRGELRVERTVADDVARRTEGVSAAFIKEMMRRVAQSVIERRLQSGDGRNAALGIDFDQALGELALGRDRVGHGLLGSNT